MFVDASSTTSVFFFLWQPSFVIVFITSLPKPLTAEVVAIVLAAVIMTAACIGSIEMKAPIDLFEYDCMR